MIWSVTAHECTLPPASLIIPTSWNNTPSTSCIDSATMLWVCRPYSWPRLAAQYRDLHPGLHPTLRGSMQLGQILQLLCPTLHYPSVSVGLAPPLPPPSSVVMHRLTSQPGVYHQCTPPCLHILNLFKLKLSSPLVSHHRPFRPQDCLVRKLPNLNQSRDPSLQLHPIWQPYRVTEQKHHHQICGRTEQVPAWRLQHLYSIRSASSLCAQFTPIIS